MILSRFLPRRRKENSVNEIYKAIEHFEYLQKRYTTTHNGKHCELVKTALAALREQAERENGCEYCIGPKMNYSPVNEMFFDVDEIVAQVTMTAKILFCPMCGRRLEEHHEAD